MLPVISKPVLSLSGRKEYALLAISSATLAPLWPKRCSISGSGRRFDLASKFAYIRPIIQTELGAENRKTKRLAKMNT